MSQINPFTYIATQNIEAHRQGSVDKGRQIRREQIQEKDIAAHEDMFEHQVERAEEDHAALDENGRQKQQPQRHPTHHDDAEREDPHIDLTA